MRVGFAGTPDFAARALAAVAAAGYTIPLVLTQPDRPHGRGMRITASPVKALAQARGIPVMQPASLCAPADRAPLLAVPLDVLVVAAYGLILPRDILGWPRHGCLNIHASLLPRWRGAAPIQRAIEAGDATSGVTIMQMDAGLDTGPMIAVRPVAIETGETAGTLHDKLAAAGAEAIVDVLAGLARDGRVDATPQPAEGATYAAKIGPADATVDWKQPAAVVERRLRALQPAPGAAAILDGAPVKLHAAVVVPYAGDAAPGVVVAAGDAGIDVACGAPGDALRVTGLQPAGRTRMTAAEFLRGHPLAPGARFAAE